MVSYLAVTTEIVGGVATPVVEVGVGVGAGAAAVDEPPPPHAINVLAKSPIEINNASVFIIPLLHEIG